MLYLSVFTVLLAFFILLTALSSFHQGKAGAVRQSVAAAFSLEERGSDSARDRRRAAALAAAASALRDLGPLIKAEIAVARVEPAGEGDTLAVILPQDSLFTDAGARLRPERAGLLHRVASVLVPRDADVQILGEFLLGGGVPPGLADSGPLVARAGALARELVHLGAPAEALSVGLERGTVGEIRLLFRIDDSADPQSGRGER